MKGIPKTTQSKKPDDGPPRTPDRLRLQAGLPQAGLPAIAASAVQVDVLVVVPAMRRVPVPVVQVVKVIVVRNRAVAAAVAVHVVVLARFVVPVRGMSDHLVPSPVGWSRGTGVLSNGP